ncbi:protein FAR1-RELATED SEQUENCE 5-like [Macadamia integrifolia]|uniref:protein FAR1-RELATED SEQUENCE 5-like n=1 Tax=Macadamia integrifolia TaxID=60698 RepID=UPI001C4F839B|nr:protein FAR1-RELATED SEQUENCE 5-like [Macadamia integrifolia]
MIILKELAGGEQHVGITEDRCRNMFRAKGRKSIRIDYQQAINYLNRNHTTDAGFFYAIRVNEEQQLTGIFWIDSRAREQYKKFSDVIVFDTTYNKNKYKFPLAPFTDVNHHMQCILFGCGLIADETKDSFIWFFQTWLQAMHNIHPKAIFTDEDPRIIRAIRHIFPSTVHRLCGWHLEKHRIIHMRPLFKKYADLKAVNKNCINDSKSPSEFEVMGKLVDIVIFIHKEIMEAFGTKGENLMILQSELKHQRKLVRSLEKKTLWSNNLDKVMTLEVMGKLVDIVIFIHKEIMEAFGTKVVQASSLPLFTAIPK